MNESKPSSLRDFINYLQGYVAAGSHSAENIHGYEEDIGTIRIRVQFAEELLVLLGEGGTQDND